MRFQKCNRTGQTHTVLTEGELAAAEVIAGRRQESDRALGIGMSATRRRVQAEVGAAKILGMDWAQERGLVGGFEIRSVAALYTVPCLTAYGDDPLDRILILAEVERDWIGGTARPTACVRLYGWAFAGDVLTKGREIVSLRSDHAKELPATALRPMSDLVKVTERRATA